MQAQPGHQGVARLGPGWVRLRAEVGNFFSISEEKANDKRVFIRTGKRDSGGQEYGRAGVLMRPRGSENRGSTGGEPREREGTGTGEGKTRELGA